MLLSWWAYIPTLVTMNITGTVTLVTVTTEHSLWWNQEFWWNSAVIRNLDRKWESTDKVWVILQLIFLYSVQ